MAENPKSAKTSKEKGSRRRKGEGTVYQRADKKWCAQVSAGRDEHGKRVRASAIGDTPEEAIKKKQEMEHSLNSDEYVEKNSIGIHDLTKVFLRDLP